MDELITDFKNPETDTERFSCETCGQEFYTSELFILHRGVRHPATLDKVEQEQYREAYANEQSAIQTFRLRALAVMIALYFGVLFLYVIYA
jgi:hypothetical protein